MTLSFHKWLPSFTAALLLLGLTACSLAADVTPPPGYQPPTAAPAETQPVTLSSTETPGATAPTALTPASAAPSGTAAAASLGSISGQVKNGSGNALPDSGLTVTLHGYDSMTEAYTQSAPVKADGSYQFPRMEMPSGRVFIATIEYKGVSYSSDVVQFQEGSDSLDLPLTIYETTTDASKLSIDRMHVFFDFSQKGLVQVITLFVISNSGDRAVVPAQEGQPLIEFALPPGASNLQFQSGQLGERYVKTTQGFGDTQPVPPGQAQHQVLYAFDLPYAGKADLSLPLLTPVESAVILVPGSGVQLQSSQLQDAGTQDIQGVSYRLYSAEKLAAGSSVAFSLSGMPGGTAASGIVTVGSTAGVLIGLAAFLLAILAAGLWMFRRRPALRPVPAPAALPETQEGLIDAIAGLDDRYEAGQLDETTYQDRRAELKERLKAIWK